MNENRPGHDSPWIGILLMLIAIGLLVATQGTDGARTAPHYIIVALYVLTSIADLLKERMTFGRGDAVTLFGATLITAVSLATALPLTRLSIATGLLGVTSLGIMIANVRGRLDRAHPR